MGGAVVGGEEEQVVAASHFLVEELQKQSHLAVKFHIHVVVFLSARAVLVSDSVCRRHAHGEQIGDAVLSKLLTVDGGFGHLESLRHSGHRSLDVGAGLGLDLLVDVLHPLWQLLHVVGRRDEVPCTLIPPVGGVGSMSGRQDGGAVFQGDADDLAFEVGGDAQLVADARGQQVAWRHLSLFGVGAHGTDVVVVAAIDLLAVFDKVVAGNAGQRGHRTGVDAGVAYGGDGRHIVDQRVLVAVALVDQAAQTVSAELWVIIIEVVPTHLVYHQTDNEFWSLDVAACQHGCCQ